MRQCTAALHVSVLPSLATLDLSGPHVAASSALRSVTCSNKATALRNEQQPLAAEQRRGMAKSKSRDKKLPSTKVSDQQPHHQHSPATPEGSALDFGDEQGQMEKAVNHLRQELAGMRSGRASPGMLEHLKVEVYGEKMPLHSLATIMARDAQLLVASVYDPGTVEAIEKGIRGSPLGLNPSIDGQEILVPVPKPSPDTVDAMKKLCKQEVEAAKTSVRNIRRGGLASLKGLDVSEDERFRAEGEVQRLTDRYISEIEQLGTQKTKDLSSV